MSKTTDLFNECVASTPQDVKQRVDWSFQIADKIDHILKERGMTQKDFAKQIGRSEAEVSRWVGGTHNFTLATLAKISTVLEIPLISVAV
ncbi:MAG: helix-turn-helix transcriptional regulator [Bacteroidales bacterium]|jgi:DNA-binding Xre family transcriptional regulator|nr:helix-turn-helix transcriptional regulator [Bacteroidales bacterium]MBR3986646.1 helix-turn-helix transcriptional regulator [Bacteroidales bacterium]